MNSFFKFVRDRRGCRHSRHAALDMHESLPSIVQILPHTQILVPRYVMDGPWWTKITCLLGSMLLAYKRSSTRSPPTHPVPHASYPSPVQHAITAPSSLRRNMPLASVHTLPRQGRRPHPLGHSHLLNCLQPSPPPSSIDAPPLHFGRYRMLRLPATPP